MLKRYHRVVNGAFRVIDAMTIGIAWLLAYWLRFTWPVIAVTKGFPSFESYAALLPLVMILWSVIFSAFRVYESKRMLRRTDEIHLLLKAHGMALILFVFLTYIFSEYRYSRAVILFFAGVGGILLIAFRLLLRNSLRSLRRRGFNLRQLLIVGEGDLVEAVLGRLDKFPELGLRVQGIVVSPNFKPSTLGGKPVLGRYRELSSILSKYSVDQILIALPRKDYQELDTVLGFLKDETLEVRIMPDVHEYVALGCEVEDFEGYPVVNINSSPLQGWSTALKRVTDITLSGLALLILSPLFLLLACLVRLGSKGPIFFAQERMGLDGKTFQMFKFRSMKVDAEAESGAVWAKEKDPRRTWLGSFLRSTSLDELPQLWNVLRGDMALVGPRPERPVFVRQFRKDIPSYMLRHKVKAGITGWAQIHGWRGNTSLNKRIEFDLYYIRNWSYVLDWKILFMTLWKGFINKNAY